ncbi:adult cuticle protein 1-like [Wyeomyia smithii]|uniref:adult cuticle protein 1-like n=1 Tax=Wyeomyia smithii TaxID=174621 RepID=UPI002467D848|nr:adult cuticle protein 1-like [Wyeomyia smithii]
MKCIAAVVMMAIALTVVEGSAYSYAPALAYSLPYAHQYAAAPWGYAAPWEQLAYTAAAYPTAYYHQPAVPVVLAQKEARYLAANRGAIHDAPLPGHAISQQSLNLEPAPGTL